VSHVDGNAIAGLLESVFGRDLTTASGRCSGCGAEREVGAIHVYRAAGVVARCPDCGTVLLRVVEAGNRVWIDLRGLTTLELGN